MAVAALLGSATAVAQGAALPYSQGFASSLGDMTVVNVEDGSPTFTHTSYYGKDWGGGAQYIGSASYAANDYLLSPSLALEAGKVYAVSVEYKGNSKANKIKLVAQDAAGNYTDVTGVIDASASTWTKVEGRFTAAVSGVYKLGVQICSEAGMGTVYFDNFAVAAGVAAKAPAAVTGASADPTVEADKFVVKLSGKAPALDFSGSELTGTVDVKVVRADSTVVFSKQGLAPGSEFAATDGAPLTDATTYSFVAVNSLGSSPAAVAECSPRFATPQAVKGLKVKQQAGGKITISWNPVTAASTEGIFIPQNVRYTVQRNAGSKVIVADKQADTTFVDTCPLPETGQDAVSYSVTAYSFTRSSAATVSASELVGDAYQGEWSESFANYSYSTRTWTVEANSVWGPTSSNYTPSCSPQDGDNGMLKYQASSGSPCWIASPKLNVKSLKNPRIDFYVYQDNSLSYQNAVVPGVRVNGVDKAFGDTIAVNGGAKGWNRYSYYVPAEARDCDFQLVFTGIPGSYAAVCIDNITIKDILDNDLAVTSLEVPANLHVGESVSLKATVHNKGAKAADAYTVAFSLNGKQLAAEARTALAADSVAVIELPFKVTPAIAGDTVTFAASVAYAADENHSNDTIEAVAAVATNDYPLPQQLSATLNGSDVTVAWNRPEISTEGATEDVSESFESWTAGSTEAANDWKFVDADGKEKRGMNGQNEKATMAAMVAANGTYNIAHTGTNVLAVTGPYSYRDTNDDWIISPEVTGGQTVRFFVAGYSSYGYVYSDNNYSLCYSTGGTEPSDFVELRAATIKTKNWTADSIVLPVDAARFAIHVTKIGDAAILFDDFTFVKGSKPLQLQGYNVYRDGEAVGSTDAETTTFTDADAAALAATSHYSVSAVYDRGESLAAGPVSVVTTGVGGALAAGAAIKAVAGGIEFTGFSAQPAAIYNVAGQLITTAVVGERTTVEVPSGLYIVVCGTAKAKVAVR